jgi:uncharacterized protein YndB with AHSA1/START domain
MTSLTLVRRIAARPSIVFEALSTAEGVAAWWGPDDLPVISAWIDARVGGLYRVRFRTLDGVEHEASGEVLEAAPPHRLAMTWTFTAGGEPEEAGRISRLEFQVRPIDGGSEVTLTHSRLRNPASSASHANGWAGALEKLVGRLGPFPNPEERRP